MTPHQTPDSPATGAAPDLGARNRLVIALLLVSAFTVILNETIMGVALPRLMDELSISASAAQWLTTAFLLTMATVIPVTGFLLQRLRTRPVFIMAMSLFSFGTLICGLAPGFEVLLVGRIVQAFGTAIMLPLLMTTIMTLVPADRRGLVMGNISIVISVAPAIGPTVSGLILSVFEWRFLFYLVLPIALVSLYLGWRRIENVNEPRYAPLDLVSVALAALGFGSLVFGLASLGEGGGEAGHGPIPLWLPIALGLGVIAVFVWRQLRLQRRDAALLDLRTFASPTFAVTVLIMAISMMALFGAIILVPIYMQTVLGLDTLQTGLLLLPGGLVMGLMAPFVGRLYDRIGPAPLVVPGAILVSAVLWAMTLLDVATPAGLVLAGHVVLSVGLALMFTPLFTAGLGSLRPNLYSHGSATISTIQQVAGAAGTALFVALMARAAGPLLAGGADTATATAAGVRAAFTVGASISLLAVVAALFLRRPEVSEDAPQPVMGH